MSAWGVVFEYIQYLHSLLCRAVDQWLCSVSVLHSEIFTGWRCYQQTVQKLICLSDLKWCCFSMFISSYSYVLFRCVNRHFPLSLSNCKPKYCKVITLLSLYPLICYPSKYSRVIIFSAVSLTSTSELADFQWMHLLLAPLVYQYSIVAVYYQKYAFLLVRSGLLTYSTWLSDHIQITRLPLFTGCMPDCHTGHLSWTGQCYVTSDELLSQTMFCFTPRFVSFVLQKWEFCPFHLRR